MQAFGIGLPELLVILVLTVIVVGPERLPEVAGQLARWIRRARSYAQYIAQDFNDVIGELEKEVGATREDWKEIAGVIGLQTSAVTQEIRDATAEARDATDLKKLEQDGGPLPPPAVAPTTQPANVVQFEPSASRQPETAEEPAAETTEAVPTPESEQTEGGGEESWYIPGRPRRRHSAE